MLNYTIECPNCKVTINVPFVKALEAKSIEDYDLAEQDAVTKLAALRVWLAEASLWRLFKYWLRKE